MWWIIGGGIIYLILVFTLGVMSIRKGHWVMFIIGIFLPFFWLIDTLMPSRRIRAPQADISEPARVAKGSSPNIRAARFSSSVRPRPCRLIRRYLAPAHALAAPAWRCRCGRRR